MFSHFFSMATRLSKLFGQYEAEITWIAMTKVPPFSLHNMKTFIKLRDSFVRIVFLSLYSEHQLMKLTCGNIIVAHRLSVVTRLAIVLLLDSIDLLLQ